MRRLGDDTLLVPELEDDERDAAKEQHPEHDRIASQEILYDFIERKTDDAGRNEGDDKLFDEIPIPELLPIDDYDGENRAELDDDVEALHEFRAGDIQDLLSKNQVASRRNGQEFGDAFDDAEDDGLEYGHADDYSR